MTLPSVYLAGPVSGLTYGQTVAWRNAATELLLPQAVALNPMRGKEHLAIDFAGLPLPCYLPARTQESIFKRDIDDLRGASAVLVGFPTSLVDSVGTAFEIGLAYSRGLPIVVWNSRAAPLHPFITAATDQQFTNLWEAVQWMKHRLTAS